MAHIATSPSQLVGTKSIEAGNPPSMLAEAKGLVSSLDERILHMAEEMNKFADKMLGSEPTRQGESSSHTAGPPGELYGLLDRIRGLHSAMTNIDEAFNRLHRVV